MKIAVGLSGGVDSAVAAALLQQQGHDIQGIFMKNWEDNTPNCPIQKDLADAQAVCDRLQIPLHTVNFAQEYWEKVFQHFLAEYQAGRTPNPDILCNSEIKFKALLNYVHTILGVEKLATGHYAQIKAHANEMALHKGSDPQKDQSYFLYALNQQQLAHSLFPLGHLHKTEVRALAKSLGLSNYDKKDSTGICFIGEKNFRPFLSHYLPAQPGPIRDEKGNLIGEHQGLMYYTLGQRQGLGIGGKKHASEAPWYVIAKDLSTNTLVVGQGKDHPLLYAQQLECKKTHWINTDIMPEQCQAKIRYRQADQPCRLERLGEDHWRVHFVSPQWAIAPGQSIVFYQDSHCLGGGIISA